MFYDLNVERPMNADQLYEILQSVVKLGYDAVAITTNLSEDYFKTTSEGKKGKKINKEDVAVPLPLNMADYKKIEKFKQLKIKIYNRVNITVYDTAMFHKISQTKQIKKYDIISYLPGTPAVLKTLAGMTDFDILCFNPTIDNNPALFYNRKLYSQFVQNGVYFEIPYGPTIMDATHRKYCFYTSSMYHAAGKSANIIVTSAASSFQHIRTPYDVISLSLLFGLNEQQAKDSITRNAADVILKARTKRMGKCTIEMSLNTADSVMEISSQDTSEVTHTLITIDETFE